MTLMMMILLLLLLLMRIEDDDDDDDHDDDDDDDEEEEEEEDADLYSASKIYAEATCSMRLKRRKDSVKMNTNYRKDKARKSLIDAQGKLERASVLGYH